MSRPQKHICTESAVLNELIDNISKFKSYYCELNCIFVDYFMPVGVAATWLISMYQK